MYFKRLAALLTLNIISIHAQDNHIFFIKETGSTNCLTVNANPKLITFETCEKSWESQQYLYNSETNKIINLLYSSCLSLKSSSKFELENCGNSTHGPSFTAPDISSLAGNDRLNLDFTNDLFTFDKKLDITRPTEFVNNNVPSSTCIYTNNEINNQGRNSYYEPTGIFGFATNDIISWKCNYGYYTLNKNQQSFSTCKANGTWSLNKPLQCIRRQCLPPKQGEESEIYLMKDNELELIDDSVKNPFYLYGDEVFYKCKNLYVPKDESSILTTTSICSGNGEWSTPPLDCKGQCNEDLIIDDAVESSRCGLIMTPNLKLWINEMKDKGKKVPTYQHGLQCNYTVKSTNPTNFINFKIPFIELEYQSQYQSTCTKDLINIQTLASNNTVLRTHQICRSELTLDETRTKPINIATNYKLETNRLMLIFQSDSEAQKEGVVIQYWSSTLNEHSLPESCQYNQTIQDIRNNMDNNLNDDDEKFGQISDYYHTAYLIIIIFCIIYGTWRFIRMCIKCCLSTKVKHSDDVSDSEESSDESELDDDSDNFSQYDMEQDEDDVDDFCLLTLLEMKANRNELGQAVEQLAMEIDGIEEGDTKRESNAAVRKDSSKIEKEEKNESCMMAVPNIGGAQRRLSNVNKIHTSLGNR